MRPFPRTGKSPDFYEINSVAVDWQCNSEDIFALARENALNLSQCASKPVVTTAKSVGALSRPSASVVSYEFDPNTSMPWDMVVPTRREDKRTLGLMKDERDRFEVGNAKLTDKQWKVWGQRSLWPIDCAVLLLHRVNPDSYRSWIYKTAFGILKNSLSDYQKDVLKRFGGDIMQDWNTVDSWRRAGQLVVGDGGISPIEFIKLAIEKGLDVTDELRNLTDDSSKKTAATWEGFDEDSPMYPRLLDIACQAHRAVTNKPDEPGTPKERITRWLTKNYSQLTINAKDQIAAVCNWNSNPGRPTKKRDS
jgi:hypothetical protein